MVQSKGLPVWQRNVWAYSHLGDCAAHRNRQDPPAREVTIQETELYLESAIYLGTARMAEQDYKREKIDKDEKRIAGYQAWDHTLPALFTSSHMGLLAKTQPCYGHTCINTHTWISFLPSPSDSDLRGYAKLTTISLYIYYFLLMRRVMASLSFDSFYLMTYH